MAVSVSFGQNATKSKWPDRFHKSDYMRFTKSLKEIEFTHQSIDWRWIPIPTARRRLASPSSHFRTQWSSQRDGMLDIALGHDTSRTKLRVCNRDRMRFPLSSPSSSGARAGQTSSACSTVLITSRRIGLGSSLRKLATLSKR